MFFFFKQKTAYEMRISDWSSDVCSSDLMFERMAEAEEEQKERPLGPCPERRRACRCDQHQGIDLEPFDPKAVDRFAQRVVAADEITQQRSEGSRVGKECVSQCRSRWSPYH